MRHLVLTLLPLSPVIATVTLKPVTVAPFTPRMSLGGGIWPSRRPSVVGLVGGIASGKSTVSRALEECCGVSIIDADKLGHESYEPGTRCFDKLVDEFGRKILSEDGTINRRALGEAVFGHPSNMSRLQSIVWPEIRLLAQSRIESLGQEGCEAVVLEAAVLLEAGWDDMCDELWVVQAPPDIARARLMKRNNFSEEQADRRISSQPMTNEERAARATVVILNEGTREDLVEKVKQTWATRKQILVGKRRRRSLLVAGSAVIVVLIAVASSMLLRRGRGFR